MKITNLFNGAPKKAENRSAKALKLFFANPLVSEYELAYYNGNEANTSHQDNDGDINQGEGDLEDRIIFDTYDTYGNVLESHAAKDPTHTVTLWGYNGQYPIARIENATYAEVQTALGLSGTDEPNESHLASLDALRTSKTDWQITTYEHIPLVGVKSITQPNGLITHYEYDAFNRLENQKDADKNLLASYQYHYANQ